MQAWLALRLGVEGLQTIRVSPSIGHHFMSHTHTHTNYTHTHASKRFSRQLQIEWQKSATLLVQIQSHHEAKIVASFSVTGANTRTE